MDSDRIALAKSQRPLSHLIRSTVKLRAASGGWMGLCPFHHETEPSFHVSDLRGTFKCFSCSAHGDAIDWMMLTRGLSLPETVQELLGSSLAGVDQSHCITVKEHKAAVSDDDNRRIKHAHELWLKAEPAAGTPAEVYLRDVRGSTVLPDVLRYVPEAYCSQTGRTAPALMSPLQDSEGHVTSVQLVYLDPTTCDAIRDKSGRRLKRTFGAMKDGAVRLAMPFSTLGIAGSVEDACAAMSLFTLPVWAVCGEGRLATVWTPPEIERLIIFADADEAGRRLAEMARERHSSAVKTVDIQYPETGKDWAEYLSMKRAA